MIFANLPTIPIAQDGLYATACGKVFWIERNSTIYNAIPKVMVGQESLSWRESGDILCTFNSTEVAFNASYRVVAFLSKTKLPDLPYKHEYVGGHPTFGVVSENSHWLGMSGSQSGMYTFEDIISAKYMKPSYKEKVGEARILVKKVETSTPPVPSNPPQEDPEEYVDITDLFPDMYARAGIDEFKADDSNFEWIMQTQEHCDLDKRRSNTLRKNYEEYKLRHRCKRKNLPADTPAKNSVLDYPIYYSVAPTHGNRFIIRLSDTQCCIVTLKGEKNNFVWGKGDDAAVDRKEYKLSSKEEYDKWTVSLSSEQQAVVATPKYYLHKDRRIGNEWMAYAEVTGDTILLHSFRQELGEPRKENGDFVAKYGETWDEVTKEEALKFYCSEWPKPIYYKNNGSGPNYIIRTSVDTCSIVISNGKILSGKAWINSADYEETTESNVMGFIAACEEFESLADKVDTPKMSKIKRAANYFVIEPSINMVRAAVNSLRYILLVGVISGGVYAYKHPEQAKKILPKIKIEFENPKIFKS